MQQRNSPIKTAREAMGLSLEALAAKAGISTATVWRCERAGIWPKHGRVRRAMAKALGIKVADMVDEVDEAVQA